jgi:S-layer homology domain
MKRMIFLAAALLAAGCSGNTATNTTSAAVEASAAPTVATTDVPMPSPSASAADTTAAAATASSSPAPASTPQYTDLAGSYGADKIAQLAQLHIFDISGPSFGANQPVLRREFVRWLYAANNAIQSDDAKKIRPAPAGEAAYFKDVPATDQNFTQIQGMQDAGISVGFPDKTFKADIPITREQALAVVLGVDCNYNGNWSTTPNQAYNYLPPWKDKATISKTYAPIIASCADTSTEVVGRVWGKTAVFRPQAKLTRDEAALMMWQTGTRTAADALASSPTPSP